MAKRGTLEHPKTKKLARGLDLPAWAALGLLEAFWHWVSRYCPRGVLTFDDLESCCDTIRFESGAKSLEKLLISSGFLEKRGRDLYVHDWHDHADDATKKALLRAGLEFGNGDKPRKPIDGQERESVATQSRTRRDTIAPAKPNLTKPNLTQPQSVDVVEFSEGIGRTKEEAEAFFREFQEAGWMVNGEPIKSWQGLFRNWTPRLKVEHGGKSPGAITVAEAERIREGGPTPGSESPFAKLKRELAEKAAQGGDSA